MIVVVNNFNSQIPKKAFLCLKHSLYSNEFILLSILYATEWKKVFLANL